MKTTVEANGTVTDEYKMGKDGTLKLKENDEVMDGEGGTRRNGKDKENAEKTKVKYEKKIKTREGEEEKEKNRRRRRRRR